jgi:urease accessory protein
VSPSPTTARRAWRDSDSLDGDAMIRPRDIARLGGKPLRGVRCRSCCGRSWRTRSERNPRSGYAAGERSHHAGAVAGIRKACTTTLSTLAIVLWKATESFKDSPASWWKPMLDPTTPCDLSDDLGPVGSPEAIADSPSDKDLQRADGAGRIVVSGSREGSYIKEVYQRSPIRILFPRAGAGTLDEAVFINTAGGVAGGDKLESGVTVLANASIAVTSQAAEKVYRALDEPACIATRLRVSENARLAWLPQETIVFDRARLRRETEINLSSRAEFLALEWLVLGRAAHGEEVIGGHISDAWCVKKDGRLIWADVFRATDEIFPHLRRKALLSNCKALATLVYFGPCLDTRLEFLRDVTPSLECLCATTSVGGLMIARFAAKMSSALRLALRSVLEQFSQELGPGPFRVPKMWSC